jgi:hypothetical protein
MSAKTMEHVVFAPQRRSSEDLSFAPTENRDLHECAQTELDKGECEMRFRPVETSIRHIIDDDSRIEFLEKNARERVQRWTEEGWESRTSGVTFIFRDPAWSRPDGTRDVEFTAKGLARIGETKYSDGNTVRFTQLYGIEIRGDEFDNCFRQYTGGDKMKFEHVREFVTQAILTYLGNVPDKTVTFT